MTGNTSPPRDFAALKALIAERAMAFPKRLTQIASFALENPDEIAFGTVSSIAEQAEVQPSALVRFAQALGYQGFSDMQEIFRSRLRDRILNYDERLQQLRHLHALALARPSPRLPRLRRLLPVLALSIAPPRLQLQPLSIGANVFRLSQALQQFQGGIAQLVALELFQLRWSILAAVVDR
jgi:hypothetical protein